MVRYLVRGTTSGLPIMQIATLIQRHPLGAPTQYQME